MAPLISRTVAAEALGVAGVGSDCTAAPNRARHRLASTPALHQRRRFCFSACAGSVAAFISHREVSWAILYVGFETAARAAVGWIVRPCGGPLQCRPCGGPLQRAA